MTRQSTIATYLRAVPEPRRSATYEAHPAFLTVARAARYNPQTSMRLDRGQIEVMDDAMAEVLRSKTGAERLMILDGLFRMATDLIRASERSRHADWDEDRVQQATARRISGEPL